MLKFQIVQIPCLSSFIYGNAEKSLALPEWAQCYLVQNPGARDAFGCYREASCNSVL